MIASKKEQSEMAKKSLLFRMAKKMIKKSKRAVEKSILRIYEEMSEEIDRGVKSKEDGEVEKDND